MKLLGMECVRGRDPEIWNHDKGNQHPKDQEYLTRKSLGKIWRLMEKMKTLDSGYLWEMSQYIVCTIWIHTRRYYDEDPSRKVWFNLIWCFYFFNNIRIMDGYSNNSLNTITTSIDVVNGRIMMRKKYSYNKGYIY